MTIATATFADQAHAAEAITALRTKGITDANISIFGRNESDVQTGADVEPGAIGKPGQGMGIDGDQDRFIDQQGDQQLTKLGQEHAARGLIGGGALGALVGVGIFLIPGVGQIAAAGTLLALMTGGFAFGASAGAIGEILTKHGVSADDASALEARVRAGDVLVTIQTLGSNISRDEIESVLKEHGGTVTNREAIAA